MQRWGSAIEAGPKGGASEVEQPFSERLLHRLTYFRVLRKGEDSANAVTYDFSGPPSGSPS